MSDIASHEVRSRPPRTPLVAPGEIEHHVADMTVTASAEVTLSRLQAKLAEQNQWLPIDGEGSATLAALIEQNSTGPLRLGYGAWRDLLLGAQFHNGLGELITAGGRTVKNVAGYDLTKFMVGQAGIFGKLLTVTTRTYRRPDGALLARFAPDARLVDRLIPGDCRPQWAVMTSQAVLCGYLADARSLDFYAGAIGAYHPRQVIQRSLQEDIDHRAALWCCTGQAFYRAAVPPARVEEFVRLARPASWVANLPFGIVIGSCVDEERSRLRKAAGTVEGSVFFREADGAPVDVPASDAERRILERLKQAFDPDGRLAPLPWLNEHRPRS